MKFIDKLYDHIENPLDNPDLIKVLVKSSFYGNGAYKYITHQYSNKKSPLAIANPYYKKRFLLKRYAIFKNALASKSNGELAKMGVADPEEFKRALSTLENPISLYEFHFKTPKLIKNEFNNNRIEDRYWVHVKSELINADFAYGINAISNRLYLNINRSQVEKLALMITNECQKRKIPYYFKYSNSIQRDDSFVIYSDNEHLEEYIEILDKIKQTGIIKFGKPPILTGVINGYIGYGAEPDNRYDEERQSYTEKRMSIVEEMKPFIIAHIHERYPDVKVSWLLATMYEVFNKIYPKIDAILDDLCNDEDFIRSYRENLQACLEEAGIDKKMCFDKYQFTDDEPMTKKIGLRISPRNTKKITIDEDNGNDNDFMNSLGIQEGTTYSDDAQGAKTIHIGDM